MSDAFAQAIHDLDEEALQLLYDRADLAAARLDLDSRAWLTHVLEKLGHHSWAQLARR